MYYTPGAIHSPLQVPKEWRDKYRGKSNQGWDIYREEVLARQKEPGLVPNNTKLVPRPETIPARDTF